MRLERDEGGIETLEMAPLQHPATLFSHRDHSVGLLQRARDRLFNQYVDALLQQATGNLAMRLSGHRKAYRVNSPNQRAPISGPFGLSLGGNRASGSLNKIADGEKLRPAFCGQGRMDPSVLPAKMPDPDNGCS